MKLQPKIVYTTLVALLIQPIAINAEAHQTPPAKVPAKGVSQPVTQTAGDYQGSQAANAHVNQADVSVNGATGALNVAINLLSFQTGLDFDLSVNYTAGTQASLGLPTGWGLSLPHLSADKQSVAYNGQTYLIDPDWEDIHNYHSGLRYMNNHGVSFTHYDQAQPLPKALSDQRYYGYRLILKDGMTYYFDPTGKVLYQVDRFNNYIEFHYLDDAAGLAHNRLSTINNNLGQHYRLTYGDNRIFIHFTDGQGLAHQKQINFTQYGINRYIDELGYATDFAYQNASKSLSRIEAPNGLVTQISYDQLRYKNQQGRMAHLPVVSKIQRYDLSQDNRLLGTSTYRYGTKTNGHNYTGYPNYVLSNHKDSLMESNNNDYHYDVLKTDIDYRTDTPQMRMQDTIYNTMAAPIESDIYLNGDDTLPIFKQTYQYKLIANKHDRSDSYNQPVSTQEWIYSSQDQRYYQQKQRDLSYDLYGNTIDIADYRYNAAHQPYLFQSQKATYDPRYGLLTEALEQQFTPLHPDHPTTIQTHNILSDDGKTLQTSQLNTSDQSDTLTPWKQTDYSYDAAGNVTEQRLSWLAKKDHPGIDATSEQTTYNADAATGKMTLTQTDAIGNRSQQIYDLYTGNLLTRITPAGDQTQYAYDADGRLITVTNSQGNTLTSNYQLYATDGHNRLIETDPMGFVQQTTFNAASDVIQRSATTDPKHPKKLILQSQTQYDQFGQTIAKIDQDGNQTTTTYNTRGLPIAHQDRFGNQTTYQYDFAQRSYQRWVNGILVGKVIYDADYQPVETITYANANNPTSAKDQFRQIIRRNAAGQPVQQQLYHQTADGKATLISDQTTDYDADGQTIGIVSKAQNDQITEHRVLDLLGHEISAVKQVRYGDQPPLSVTRSHNTYDQAGHLITQTNQLGQQTQYQQDAQHNTATVIYPNGTQVLNHYDSLGQLAKSIYTPLDQPSQTLAYQYDPSGHLIKVTQGDDANEIVYDLAGHVIETIDPAGDSQKMVYDAKGRMISQTDAAGNQTAYHYNALGQLVQQISTLGKIEYTYATKQQPDANGQYGQLMQASVLGQYKLSQQPDAFGRQARVTRTDMTGQRLVSVAKHYDTAGHLGSIKVVSDLDATDANLNYREAYTYDGLGQLVDVQKDSLQQQPLLHTHYVYDGNQNILTKQLGNQITTYDYNQADQLIHYTEHGQVHDQSYDANGNLVTDGQGNHYTFNLFGQLAQVDLADGQSVTYNYAPSGLRSNRYQGEQSQRFYYNQDDQINQVDQGDEQLGFVFNNGQRVASFNAQTHQPSLWFISANDVGNTIATLTKNAHTQGLDLHGSQSYQAYGQGVSGDLKTSVGQHFTFNGQYQDPATGLVDLKARSYDPVTQRFISQDSYPLWNRYNFANADPINHVDPTGHSAAQVVNYTLNGIGLVGSLVGAAFSGGATLPLAASISGGLAASTGIAAQATADAGASETATKALITTSLITGVAASVMDITSIVAGVKAGRSMVVSNKELNYLPRCLFDQQAAEARLVDEQASNALSKETALKKFGAMKKKQLHDLNQENLQSALAQRKADQILNALQRKKKVNILDKIEYHSAKGKIKNVTSNYSSRFKGAELPAIEEVSELERPVMSSYDHYHALVNQDPLFELPIIEDSPRPSMRRAIKNKLFKGRK